MVSMVGNIKFNEQGLVPAIAQDATSKEVLMLAWMNEEALNKTLETGDVWYFSRSRNELWRKGETSGHTQKLIKLEIDCDNDAILLTVEQTGVACHTGRKNCFFNELKDGELVVNSEVEIDPEEAYGKE